VLRSEVIGAGRFEGNFKLDEELNCKFDEDNPCKLNGRPAPITSLLNTLAEPCLLYKGLSAFVGSEEGGLV
jgi:hypothetical protein